MKQGRTVGDVSRLTGVSVRTLHYYDEAGLLRPAEVTESGYRMYGDAELKRLERILLLRELDFPLKTIAELLEHGADAASLGMQRELLRLRRDRLDRLIANIDDMMEGKADMDFKNFDNSEFESKRQEYEAEAKARWGATQAYRQSAKKTAGYTKDKWNEVNAWQAAIIAGFAAIRGGAPDSPEALRQVERWRDYITENFYDCTPEIMAGLAEMYVADERFRKNIDAAGEGTAEFIQKAVSAKLARS